MKNDGISRYHRLYWYVVAAMILCLMCVYSAPVSYAGSVTSVGEMNLGTPHSSLGANSTSPSRFLSSLGNAPLSINRELFYATVPSYATVAHNYTIEVLVVNNSTSPIPIFVQLLVPVGAMIVHPLFLQTVVEGRSQILTNFSVIPFNTKFAAPINVSAQLSIWFFNNMSRPQLVDQVSSLVYQINPYTYSSYAAAVLVLIVLTSFGIILGYAIRRRKYRAQQLRESWSNQINPVTSTGSE